MKIGNNTENLSQIQNAQNPSSSLSSRQPAVSPSAPVSADSAHLSTVAGQVTQSASDSDVRLDKVAAIRSALAAGTYSVSAAQVASRLVDSMLERNQ